jgi:hypothetical protein
MQEKKTALEAESCTKFNGSRRVPVDPEAPYATPVAIRRVYWTIRRPDKGYTLLKGATTDDVEPEDIV